MLAENTGYLKFKAVVAHIVTAGEGTEVLLKWHARRWAQIEASLERACGRSDLVDTFLREYADASVQDLWQLLLDDADCVKEGATINAAETLLMQVQLYADATADEERPMSAPLLPEIVDTSALNYQLAWVA